MLARFINHHISPLNIEDSEVLEKAVRVAKHLNNRLLPHASAPPA